MSTTEAKFPKTVEGLKEAVRKFRRIVRSFLRQPTLSPNRKHDRIFRNLLTYIDVQLGRMLSRKPPPVDLTALVARDLIEVALWCEFVTANADSMQRFRDEVEIDLLDMFKLINPSDKNYLNVEKAIRKMGVTGKSMRLEKSRERDRFWFRLCSKMIHPTGWSINVLANTSKAEYWRLELGSYALSCSIRAVSSLTGLSLPEYIQR
jgi:hypothetical protein